MIMKEIVWIGRSILCFCSIINLLAIVAAQNPPNATTDPSEVRVLNSIFQQWRISAQSNWNISGEPCTGVAIDSTQPGGDGGLFNPAIKCDCTDANGTLCHIITLRVYAISVEGVIPDELWNLTFLSNLDLSQNYLTGPLSPSIGNLTRMQYLSLGTNSLSGELPRELGRLTELISLSVSSNNFSGPLPSELGELRKLEQIYLDSSGLSGAIPPSLANLRRMSQVWASDTGFTGRIPDFIGNWSRLTVLRLQGTGLQGPIPSSFSNLTSLIDLRISDLSNGTSSLDFIANLRSLNILVLRNNNISGSVPANIPEYPSLSQLDLSFNNLSGEIPDSLFTSSLNYLFLGNNRLTGTLPELKNSSLNNIDLSYNELSGPFPSWINEQNLQINLVANNFSLQSGSNSSNLPSGLNCLQRSFPCNRDAPIYYNFAIKCGGPPITSANQVVYESDIAPLGPATYNVSRTERWAVSNVGLFAGNHNISYTAYSQMRRSTNYSELFQTSRISAGSLRYYGLGLENGNYTLTLQFAEMQIVNPPTWQSLGRRIFDIYIQGILMEKDFDIKREAGGASFRAVQREIRNVEVTENYVEVHLFWAGKGTCCIPAQGTYGPSISAISATPEFEPSVANIPPTSRRATNRTGLIVGIVVPVAVVTFLSLFAVYFFAQRRKKRRTQEDEGAEFLGMDTRPYTFTYAALRDATDDFNPSNKLGEGGFGAVYKGTLEDGREIAVKQLSVASHQGKSQFVAEIATISAVQHRNLVKLYGCCIEANKRLLVYEYHENKSLDQALFVGEGKSSLHLNWPTRFDICLGVSRGLAYLHEESRLRIVHRDVKASNILLDSDLNPKISDFGLAKLYDDKKTHISTRVAGTIGYLAPEYAMRGHLTEKADVFGFGVVALEIVSGRTNSDSNLEADKIYLLEWAWNLHETDRELELVDPNLSDFDEEEVKRTIGVALLCTQTSPNLRPPMSRVVAMLSGDMEVSSITTRPGYLTDWKFNDTTSFMSNEKDTSTSKTEESHSGSSSSTTIVTGADYSPINASHPMLSETVGEDR